MRCIYSVRCNLLLDTSGASIYVQFSPDSARQYLQITADN